MNNFTSAGSGKSMPSLVRSDDGALAALALAQRWLAATRGSLRAVLEWTAAASRHAATRREFQRLDDNALRDLGITRSEFDSYWAESMGRADQSRLRVMQDFHGSPL